MNWSKISIRFLLSGIIFAFVTLFIIGCSKKTRISENDPNINSPRSYEIVDLANKSIHLKNKESLNNQTLYRNGNMVGSNTRIDAGYQQIFDNVTLKGSWQNDTFALAWFVSGKNAEENFLAIIQIIHLGKVVLLDKMYTIATTPRWNTLLDPNDIRIIGKNRQNCGLTLETHFGRNSAYFNSLEGNNLHLENITLNTVESINGNSPNQNRYILISSSNNSQLPDANPKIDYIKIKNCFIQGNVMIRYGGNTIDSQLIYKGINNIEIIDNKLSKVGDFFTVSNAVYSVARIQNNLIENIYGITFFFPISGSNFDHEDVSKNRKNLTFSDNIITNEAAIFLPGVTYLSPIIAKGYDFTVRNNRIENILSLNPEAAAYGFYCSASNHLLVEDNYIKNCGGISSIDKTHSSSLLKLKGAQNATVRNNEFHFDQSGLQLLGLLRRNQKLSDINPQFWKLCLFDQWRNPGVDSTSTMIFENNIFKTATLSDYSHMFDAHINMTSNRFEIDYYMNTPVNNWDNQGVRLPYTMFYFRNPIKKGTFAFNNNSVIIKESAGGPFYLTVNRDDNKDFQSISYQNNIFNIPTDMGIDIGRTPEFIANNSTTGQGSLFFSHPTTLSKNTFVSNMKISQSSESISNHSKGLLNIRAHGILSFRVKRPTSDQMTLMNITLPDFHYYEDRDSLPISLHIKISYNRGVRLEKHTYHIMIDKGNTSYFIDEYKRQTSSAMVWSQNHNTPPFKNSIGAIKSTAEKDIKLFWSSQAASVFDHQHGFLVLEGLRGTTDLEIEAKVLPTPINNRTSTQAKQAITNQTIFER
jgi:hypothetical protein